MKRHLPIAKSAGDRFSNGPRKVFLAGRIAGLLAFGMLTLRADPEIQRTAREEGALVFENVDASDEAKAREVYAAVRAHFTRITGREVGKLPIRVRLVESLGRGEASRASSHVLGVTVHREGRSEIQISALQQRSFGRVLAHELVHVFSREACGAAVNRVLSEGLADYIASLLYSAEVNRDLRAASHVKTRDPRLLPYVRGYHFCLHHAEREGFGEFYARQIGRPDFGFGDLEGAWKRRASH